MADILYGADLGAVATDQYGNLFIGLVMNIYADNKGTTPFTLTRKANDDLTVGISTAGQVTVNTLGRVAFYATDTDRTLWLKNGPYFWAINPVSPSETLQYRIDTALTGVNNTLTTFDKRLSDTQADVDALTAKSAAPPYQTWRARQAAATTIPTGTYKSLNFATIQNTPTAFAVTTNADTLAVTAEGWYRIATRTTYTANTSGARATQLLLNPAATTTSSTTQPAGFAAEDSRATANGAVTTNQVVEDVYLRTTDTFSVVGWQSSSANLTTVPARTTLSITWLGTAA